MTAASGVLTASGTMAAALDVLAGAIGTQQSVNGVTPDAVILNPVDLAKLRTSKSSGSGEYQLGDPMTAGAATLWGIPVLPTPAAAAGTVWLARRTPVSSTSGPPSASPPARPG